MYIYIYTHTYTHLLSHVLRCGFKTSFCIGVQASPLLLRPMSPTVIVHPPEPASALSAATWLRFSALGLSRSLWLPGLPPSPSSPRINNNMTRNVVHYNCMHCNGYPRRHTYIPCRRALMLACLSIAYSQLYNSMHLWMYAGIAGALACIPSVLVHASLHRRHTHVHTQLAFGVLGHLYEHFPLSLPIDYR